MAAEIEQPSIARDEEARSAATCGSEDQVILRVAVTGATPSSGMATSEPAALSKLAVERTCLARTPYRLAILGVASLSASSRIIPSEITSSKR